MMNEQGRPTDEHGNLIPPKNELDAIMQELENDHRRDPRDRFVEAQREWHRRDAARRYGQEHAAQESAQDVLNRLTQAGWVFFSPPMLGSPDQERDLTREREQARAKQSCAYAIAPRASVLDPSGRLWAEGSEFDPSAFGDAVTAAAAVLVLANRHILLHSAALEREKHTKTSSRYIVGNKGAIMSSRGIRCPGASVSAEDFAREASILPAQPERLDTMSRRILPATKETVLSAASDGTAELQDWIARGYVTDTQQQQEAKGRKRASA